MSIKVYTLEEAAEILQVHPRTVYNYVHNGSIRAIKVGRSWRISEDNLRQFVNGEAQEVSEKEDEKKE